jgi:hypothetical protein
VNPRRNGRRDQGAAAVEFVLVLPVLLVILFGIIDFGRLMHAKLELAEAAREGARAAALVSVDEGRSTIDEIVGGMSSDMDQPYDIGGCGPTAIPGQDARVTLVYHFSFVTPFLGIGGEDGRLTLTQTAVMPCM